MIASVAFRNFKALRGTQLALSPFNLLIGPNGSGKTSLIQAILRLHVLAGMPLREPDQDSERNPEGAEITFRFCPSYDGLEASLGCVSDSSCDLLQVIPLTTGEGVDDWEGLRKRLHGIRSYMFDHTAIAEPSSSTQTRIELEPSGGNLASVLAERRVSQPKEFTRMTEELFRLLPEYDGLDVVPLANDRVELRMRLAGEEEWIAANDLSQGTLYILVILALAFDPSPPSVVCIEEIDRGVHPRLLRQIRDLLYRLSYPKETGVSRAPVQVVATTQSPYMLDLFRDHPEEVIITEKRGAVARFCRLDACLALPDMLSSGSLGDLWFSGIIGGVPEEK